MASGNLLHSGPYERTVDWFADASALYPRTPLAAGLVGVPVLAYIARGRIGMADVSGYPSRLAGPDEESRLHKVMSTARACSDPTGSTPRQGAAFWQNLAPGRHPYKFAGVRPLVQQALAAAHTRFDITERQAATFGFNITRSPIDPMWYA